MIDHRKTLLLASISMLTVFCLSGGATAQEAAGPRLKTQYKGENWSFKISGRVQYDYTDAEFDTANVTIRDGEIRRSRLGFSGKYGKNLGYAIEVNAADDGDVVVTKAYLDWKPEGAGFGIRVGQFKTPNSLDEQTSSRFISTLERSAFTDAFGFDRRVGVGLNAKGKNHTVSAGVFTDNFDTPSRRTNFVLAARGTYTPVNEKNKLVHLGASIRHRELRKSASPIRYRQRPASHIPGRVISTGRIADVDTFFGVEAATIQDRFWAAAEYGRLEADCVTCANDPSFGGAYLEGGMFVGGRKTYKGGKFNRPKVDRPVNKGGWGAASFVARYDTLDLSDGDVDGGDYDAIILGADWWPTRHTRVGINYFDVDTDLGSSTSGLDGAVANLVRNGVQSESTRGFTVRAQLDF